MSEVWVFFYGTFMSATILRKHRLDCEATFPAKIAGYSLTIRPRVNLIKDAEGFAYGGLALIEQSQLANLYSKVYESFGLSYYPQPVLAETLEGSIRPALCFISEGFAEEKPDPEYINEMIMCAREMQAPETYVAHIKSFSK